MSYDVSMNSRSFQLIGHASFVAKCSLQKVTDRSNFYSIYNAAVLGTTGFKASIKVKKKSFKSAKKPPEALEYFPRKTWTIANGQKPEKSLDNHLINFTTKVVIFSLKKNESSSFPFRKKIGKLSFKCEMQFSFLCFFYARDMRELKIIQQ